LSKGEAETWSRKLVEPGSRSDLRRKIGQLVVEVDWLSKKCKELGIDP
jgi:hypothetical protein